jgi:3-dehydroquinate synthase
MSKFHPAEPHIQVDEWLPINELFARIPQDDFCVIIDGRVELLHNLQVEESLSLVAGESAKTFETLQQVMAYIEKRRLQGAQNVLAVGGGTIGDVVGLAAHLVKRGMPLIHVPSTLLAAVDSSVGGKVAINSDSGKNAFGAYQFADSCYLVKELWETLEQQQLADGVAEVAKIALIDSPAAVAKLGENLSKVELVRLGRKIKTDIVNQDPFEKAGLRHSLNFGHTIGHALEAISDYRISHGRAVAMGMRAALELGQQQGITGAATAKQANDLLDSLKLANIADLGNALHGKSWQQFVAALSLDKKGFLQFVLLKDIGDAAVVPVSETAVRKLFDLWSNR